MLRSKFSVICTQSVRITSNRIHRTNTFKAGSLTLQQKHNYATVGEMIQKLRFQFFHDPRHHLDYDKWAKVFCIEGNVGVGKADFGKEFAEKLDLKFYSIATTNYEITRLKHQMADEWIDWMLNPESVYQQVNRLSVDQYCKDPKDWLHTAKLQLSLQRNRYFQYCDAIAHLIRTGQGVTTIRHHYSDTVHAEVQKQLGWLRKDVYYYYDLFNFVCNEHLYHPQVILYLDAPAEFCYEKVQAGNNEAEKHLPLDYYKRVEDNYKNVFIPRAEKYGVNVIELDWTDPIPMKRVIEDLEDMATLTSPTCKWNTQQNTALKSVMKFCEDMDYRRARFSMYVDIEELWLDDSSVEAFEVEQELLPWKYPRGLNASLGDRNIFLKG